MALKELDQDMRAMTNALYSNGMIGGDDLKREIDAIRLRWKQTRSELLHLEEQEAEDEFDEESPLMQGIHRRGP